MSARPRYVVEVLSRYVAGFFPLYDPWGRFYWERLPVRAMIPVNSATVCKAERMGRRAVSAEGRPFEMRYTTALPDIIAVLQDEAVKENTWVREEVVRIYLELHKVSMLRTVEAWHEGRLVGALLGIMLPGTFIAETMYGLVPEASKACLCRLIRDCAAAGFEIIDVQTPHDVDEFGMPRSAPGVTAHPCMRLGEMHVSVSEYLRRFVAAWKRGFSGGVEQWLAAARCVREGGLVAPGVGEADLIAARRYLGL